MKLGNEKMKDNLRRTERSVITQGRCTVFCCFFVVVVVVLWFTDP